MKNEDKGFSYILAREIRTILREPIYLTCIVAIPLFCYFLFSSLMKDGVPTDLPIGVVDLDNSTVSRSLIRTADAMMEIEVAGKYESYTQAREAMQRGEIYSFMQIPHNFAALAGNGKQPELAFFSNDAYYVAGAFSSKALKTISLLANGSVVKSVLAAKGTSEYAMNVQLMPVRLDSHPLGNPWTSYSIYINNVILPAMLELMILLMTVYAIGIEVKNGKSRRLLVEGNRSILRVVLAKLLPQTLLFFMMIMILNAILYGYLGYPLKNGLMPLTVGGLLFVLSCQAIGVLFVSIFPSMRLAMSASSLTGALGFSIAGFSMPVESMYAPFQWLSHVYPIRHYFMIYNGQALNGAPLYYSLDHYLMMAILILVPLFVLPLLKSTYFKQQYEL